MMVKVYRMESLLWNISTKWNKIAYLFFTLTWRCWGKNPSKIKLVQYSL